MFRISEVNVSEMTFRLSFRISEMTLRLIDSLTLFQNCFVIILHQNYFIKQIFCFIDFLLSLYHNTAVPRQKDLSEVDSIVSVSTKPFT